MPKETLELFEEFKNKDPVDMLWDSIVFQYSAIVRAQKLMYVKNANDVVSDVTSWEISPEYANSATGEPLRIKESRDFERAWERQESFIKAQSTALGTLSNLIRRFVALADEKDERRLKLDLMRAQIKNLSESSESDAARDWKQSVIAEANRRQKEMSEDEE